MYQERDTAVCMAVVPWVDQKWAILNILILQSNNINKQVTELQQEKRSQLIIVA